MPTSSSVQSFQSRAVSTPNHRLPSRAGFARVSFRLQMPKNSKRQSKRSQNKSCGAKLMLSPVPNRYVTRMAYYDEFSLTEPAAGVGTFTTFSLNGCYDPNISGVGAQPTSFDQWSQMYNRFKVVRADIRLIFINGSSTTVPTVGWMVSSTTTAPSTSASWPCQRLCNYTTLCQTTGGACRAEFKASFYPWENLSLTKAQYMDEADYSHTSSANPLKQSYLQVFVRGVTNVGLTLGSVRIVYHVELSDPYPLASS